MTYSIKDLQKRYGVGEHTIYGWINRKEIIAINVARKTGGRPKYRITQEALDNFELLRATKSPQQKTKRCKKSTDDIKRVYGGW